MDKGYRLNMLIKILNYLKITIFLAKNEEKRSEVNTLFK
jgi:hypothetical protein